MISQDFRVQCVAIFINLLVLFLAFANTKQFQAGMMGLLVNFNFLSCFKLSGEEETSAGPSSGEFNAVVWTGVLYGLSCILIRTFGLLLQWACNGKDVICTPWSSSAYRVFYTMFRLCKLTTGLTYL
jgi:hypothetical protein